MFAWGSYDQSKPRVRLLLEELKARGSLRAEINMPVWQNVRDKAVAGRLKIVKVLLHLMRSYPPAILKLLRQPSRGAILLAYPAIPDIFVAWPFARLRRHTIVFDAFISLYDTIVSDRRMVPRKSITAKLVWAVEWLALRLADIVIVDTDQHGDFFAAQFTIPREKFQTILVGAEPNFWSIRGSKSAGLPISGSNDLPVALFYGQLIPLHGIDTILEAIQRTEGERIHWLLIGSGQEEQKLRHFIAENAGLAVTWLPWVDYEQLPAIISASNVALGIFGASDKASRVIPNKVFQVLAAGTPLITRESSGVARLKQTHPRAIQTVPPADGRALAAAVLDAIQGCSTWKPVPAGFRAELGPGPGVDALLARLRRT